MSNRRIAAKAPAVFPAPTCARDPDREEHSCAEKSTTAFASLSSSLSRGGAASLQPAEPFPVSSIKVSPARGPQCGAEALALPPHGRCRAALQCELE